LEAYGTPDKSKPEYGEYDFLRGEWEASMQTIAEDGTTTPIEAKAYITGFYHSDGRTFQTCFEAPGFHSTDVRAFEESSGNWRASFTNAQSQRWNSLKSVKVGDTMETLVPGGYAGTADFDTKTVMHSIADESFRNDVFQRDKGSDVWRKTFEMVYRRLPTDPNGPRC
ncbi:unnamed protein product, partial [Ectocarpus sp. 13 AM-2016]